MVLVDAGASRNAPAGHMHGFLSRDGMPPGERLAAGRSELSSYGGRLIDDTVTGIEPGFHVRLANGSHLRARRILVATGLRDELPDIPGVRERWGGTCCIARTAMAKGPRAAARGAGGAP